MKKLVVSLCCVAMAAVACSEKPEITLDPVSGTRTVTLTASLPQTKVDVNTTTGKVTWSDGDAIAVWNTEGNKFEFVIESGAGTDNATFKCTTFDGTLGTKAVYPYSWAGVAEGTVTIPEYIPWVDGYVPAVMASAVSEITAGEIAPLYFHNLMAIMEFTLQDVPAYACALKLWSRDGADLHGTWTVSADCTSLTGITTGGNTQQVIYFPYKTAYGADATLKICAAVPAYAYTDFKIRVLDGDESVIENTGKAVASSVTSRMGGNPDAYVVMPAFNVRSLVGNARDNYVKVEGVKWAKGNLRAWKSGNSGTGWQSGWNIYDHQWESQFSLTRTDMTGSSLTGLTLDTSIFKEESIYSHWDYFSWGTIARASRVHNTVLTSTTAEFEISGKVFSGASGDISTFSELTGDDRFVDGGFASNPSICGDLAFWASKGQYRMPTKLEIAKLYAKNYVGAGSNYAHMQAGYYMDENNNKLMGILFTSCPSWETTTYNKTAIALTEADMESGVFLPKIGERTTNANPNTYDAKTINYFNGWGVYWSGTYGGLNSGFEDCARHINFTGANEMTYGYTSKLSNTITGQTKLGNAIRPVLVD